MKSNVNLTEGNISKTLMKLALPIMGSSFIQMAYNLTDTMWLGRYSTKAVAGAGTAGYLLWFGSALVLIASIGIGIGTSHAYGREDLEDAKKYISNGIKLNVFMAIIYSLLCLVFRNEIIGFFNLGDTETIKMAVNYLTIVSIGGILFFINPVFSAIYNSAGNSTTPFKINVIGLVTNIILDPILIFGMGPVPEMGVIGAAIATVFAQFIVTLMYIVASKRNQLFLKLHLLTKPNMDYIKKISKLGFPAFLQSGTHSFISMILGRILAQWGPIPVAVQNIGSQIESISWMTAEGFATAIAAFVGQNYGAKQYERLEEGYYKGLKIVGGIGLFSSIMFIFFGKSIFSLFTPEDMTAIEYGTRYLMIFGLSQFFMTIEIGTAGAFNGIGKTHIPASTGMIGNISRIPLALLLSSTALGMTGVWWSMSMTSVFKGIALFTWFMFIIKRKSYKKQADY